MSFNPADGEIPVSAEQDIEITANGSNFPDGTYEATITVTLGEEEIKIPLQLEVLTKVSDHRNLHPMNFELLTPYPNPFNPSATVEIAIEKQQTINISESNLPISQLIETIETDTEIILTKINKPAAKISKI